MPCYLFTYHAYLSWLPDRKRGYVRRHKGVLPKNDDEADRYRARAKESAVEFHERIQRVLIDEVLVAAGFQRFRPHHLATDASHFHVLVSWTDDRPWSRLRDGIRTSLTRRLNREFGRRTWFLESASRKRVTDRQHFDYHCMVYLPDHPGWKWCERCGLYRKRPPQLK